jgi:hypothetical protein
MIEVVKRPYSWNWSGNPAFYELYSLAAELDPDIYFQVEIFFRNPGDVTYRSIGTEELYPFEGTAKFNVSDYLHSQLQYELPSFSGDEKLCYESLLQTGDFYIRYREIDPDVVGVPAWTETETAFLRYMIIGGIDYMKFRGNNFWENHFDINKPFLTWDMNGRLASRSERMYLAWLNTQENTTAEDIVARVIVHWTDGTSDTAPDQVLNTGLLVTYGAIYFIPCGATQWELQALQPAKRIYYWTVQVFDTAEDPDLALSEQFKFYADNRNDYNDMTLHYRNSLGGINSIMVRGVIQQKLNYEYTVQDRYVEADYYNGKSVSPRKVIANNREELRYIGDIGYLSKTMQDRVRDMHLVRDVWRCVDEKWLPVQLVTNNNDHRTSESQLFSVPLEFMMADGGNNYYTPSTVDLGDGELSSNASNASIENFEMTQIDQGADYDLEIDFDIDDPDAEGVIAFEYQVKREHGAVQSDVVASLPLTIPGLNKNEAYVITVQPVNPQGVKGAMYRTWFFNGKFGVGADNSSVINLSDNDAQIDLTTDGTPLLTNQTADAADMKVFNHGVDGDADIVLTNDSFIFTGMIKLVTDSAEYIGTISPANIVTFTAVDVNANGFAIIIQ